MSDYDLDDFIDSLNDAAIEERADRQDAVCGGWDGYFDTYSGDRLLDGADSSWQVGSGEWREGRQ